MEPPLKDKPDSLSLSGGFVFPSYYIQPRSNLAVFLAGSEEEILASFHSSTRSNVARARRRGVTVEEVAPSPALEEEFFQMSHDTADRNGGQNIYPGRAYFDSFFKTIPVASATSDPGKLALKIYLGRVDGRPAAMHAVLFFGTTATYIYGAGYRQMLPSKVTTYLHWQALLDAKKRGCTYYDLGGIDEAKWPSLTAFKRQFKGEEFTYCGNIDLPLRPAIYRWYNIFRRLKKLR